jgi:hypothetical protein
MERLAFVLLLAVACGNSPPPEAVAVPQTATASALPPPSPSPGAPSASTNEESVEGEFKVIAKAGTARKSVDAYLGREFVVLSASHETLVFPSEKVTPEDLRTMDGKRVRVTGVREEAKPANPMEQAPLGPDGRPMTRPGGLRAHRIELLP